MLSREDNELLTRVGPGTAMGNTMRRYWMPALLGWELPEPDGPPVRVRLLCEDLVAFRDSLGRIGLLDEYCPHRRVSLFFGRNEECEQLPPRSPGPEDRDVHRHRGRQRAGPRRPGEHGTDRRPQPGAPGPGRQGHHPGPSPPPAGREDRPGGRDAARDQSDLLRAPGLRGRAAA